MSTVLAFKKKVMRGRSESEGERGSESTHTLAQQWHPRSKGKGDENFFTFTVVLSLLLSVVIK